MFRMEDTDQVLMDNPNIYVYRLIVYATQRLIRRFLNSVYFRTLDARSKERNGVYLACVDSLKGWSSSFILIFQKLCMLCVLICVCCTKFI